MDTPHRPLIAGISAGLLLLAAAGTRATRSPAIAPAPRVDPGPIVRAPAPAVDPPESGQSSLLGSAPVKPTAYHGRNRSLLMIHAGGDAVDGPIYRLS